MTYTQRRLKEDCSCKKGPLQVDEPAIHSKNECHHVSFELKSFLTTSIAQALAEERARVGGEIEGRVLIYSARSNMWFRKGNKALYTNCDETAKQENQALNDLLASLSPKSSEAGEINIKE